MYVSITSNVKSIYLKIYIAIIILKTKLNEHKNFTLNLKWK